MQVQNETNFETVVLPGYDREGREVASVVVKGTYRLRSGGLELVEEEERDPIRWSDEHWGAPGESPVKYEADVAPFKPAADLVLLGNAYDARGREIRRQQIEFHVGPVSKRATVVGEERGDRIPLHRLEEMRRGGPRWTQSRKPKDGVGFYPRHCKPRLGYAGTYDEAWEQARAPFLPADFDYRFFQAAFPDLVYPGYLQGGERVRAVGVSPEGTLDMQLPSTQVEVEAFLAETEETHRAQLDTLVLDAEQRRLSLTWRMWLGIEGGPGELRGFIVRATEQPS